MMLGIIPARSGSKGVKNKNVKKIAGKPLVDWTIDAVSGIIPFVVTTNYNINYNFNHRQINVIKRPERLCRDDTLMLPVVCHAIKEYEKISLQKVTSICLLQPTSPLRTRYNILAAIQCFYRYKTGIFSFYNIQLKERSKVFNKHNANYHCQRNGAIFIATREMIEKDGKLFDQYGVGYEMAPSESVDIDSEDDWHIAESLLLNKKEI